MSYTSDLFTELQEAHDRLDHAMAEKPGETLSRFVFNNEGPMAEVSEIADKIDREIASSQPQSEAHQPDTHPSSTWRNYWDLCMAVVYAAGEVAAKDKLLMSFRDPETSHKVQHVIKRHFKGKVECLKDARADRIADFFRAVDMVNWYARQHDLSQVSAMKLMGMLEDKNARKRFRHHIQKHIDGDHPPFEMDEIPDRDFHKKPC